MERSERLAELFEELIPFNKTLGMKVDAVADGTCVIRLPARPEHIGNFLLPAIHGGVMSAMADAAGGLAVFSRLPPAHSCATLDLRIDYLRPAKADRDLVARAQVVRLGNRVGVVNVDLFQDGDPRPLAQVRAAYNVVAHRLLPE
ncbi:MAG TPA: PaaI family thioesterase [Myxococcota bacterium]|nr:PaaI family thioesterase [Myxococcota bacterium]